MTPYLAFVQKTNPAPAASPVTEVSLSLMISVAALRLVNFIERTFSLFRRTPA